MHFCSDRRKKKKKKISLHIAYYICLWRRPSWTRQQWSKSSLAHSVSSYFQHLSRGIPEEFCFVYLPISHPQAYPTKAKPRLVKIPLLAPHRGKTLKDVQKGKNPSLAPYLQVQRPRGKKSMLAREMKESPSPSAPKYQGSTKVMNTSYSHLICVFSSLNANGYQSRNSDFAAQICTSPNTDRPCCCTRRSTNTSWNLRTIPPIKILQCLSIFFNTHCF